MARPDSRRCLRGIIPHNNRDPDHMDPLSYQDHRAFPLPKSLFPRKEKEIVGLWSFELLAILFRWCHLAKHGSDVPISEDAGSGGENGIVKLCPLVAKA